MSIIHESQSVQTDFKRGSYWLHESPFLPYRDSRSTQLGAPSLKASALKGLLADQSMIKSELFEHVPWKIAQEIWEFLRTRGKQTLLMWQIMCSCYPQDFHQVSPSYSLRVKVPSSSMGPYLKMMHSPSHSWNAVLSFSTAYASTADLVDMAQITDLVALEINNETPVNKNTIVFRGQPSAGMDDSLVHSWLQGVQSSGQFQRLQVLRLYEQRGLTSKVFWMLERFPQLKVVVLYRCEEITRCLNQKLEGSRRALLQNGWLIRRFDHLPSETQEECIVTHLGPLYSMYQKLNDSGRSDGQGAHRTQTLPSPRCPVLEFAIPHLDYADPDKLSRRARYAAKSIFIVTRSGESHSKRQAPVEERQPRGRGKRVMRQQGSKNAMDVLNDFLAM